MNVPISFSLGVVLYESLAGHHPFRAEPADLTADPVERSAPALLPPAAPRAMNAVLARMLAKEPAQRYQSCTDVLADIRAVRDGRKPVLGKSWTFANFSLPPRIVWLPVLVTFIVLIALLLRGSFSRNAMVGCSGKRIRPSTGRASF